MTLSVGELKPEGHFGAAKPGFVFSEFQSFGACPICESQSSVVLFTDRNRRENLDITGKYIRCSVCHHVYLDPFPSPAKLSRAYEMLHSRIDDRGGLRPFADGKGVLRSLIRASRKLRRRPHSWPRENGQGQRLLDVGCGTVTKLDEFRARGWKVVGVDFSAAVLRVASACIPEGAFIQADAHALPFQGESFDVIRVDNVMEHIPETVLLLSKLRSLLKPGGQLYVYVPNSEAWSVRLFAGAALNYWIPFHIHYFDSQSLRLALQKAGFSHISIQYHNPPNWLADSAKQKFGLNVYKKSKWDPLLRLLFMPMNLTTAFSRYAEELVAEARV
jgi:ubiquinone/menaquinone biosynthesis C-methylase UbiE